MRALLAVDDAVLAEPSVATVAVVSIVAVVIIAPVLALCGDCFQERAPQDGPFNHHHQQPPPRPPYPNNAPPPGPYGPPGGHPGYNSFGGLQGYASGHSAYSGHPGYSSTGPGGYTGPPPPHSGSYQGSYHQAAPPGPPQHQQRAAGFQGQAPGPFPGQPPPPQQKPPPQQPSAPQPAPGTDLQPADASLEAVAVVLHQVCDTMKGTIKPGKTLVRSTIRVGISAVVADVTTNYAVDETMMLFPDKNKKGRQMRLYEQLNLKDSMPLVSVDNDIFSHEEAGRKLTLPSAIFVNRVKTLGDALKGMKTVEEKQQELFGIWSQLAKVLKMFHQRGWYLRDVTYDNVVHVRMGVTEGWTLLEFGNASRERSGINKSSIPPRHCPPELAATMLNREDGRVHLNPAYDMWMLGMLVYEVMTGEPYWGTSLKDSQVLQIMADRNKPLPHEEKPVLNLVQLILLNLLHRDPLERLNSSDLIKRLEADMATAGARTMNPGPIVNQEDIVLAGN